MQENNPIKRIVILGGGSAGWLTAGLIAAEHDAHKPEGVEVTVIESPEVSPIGVGEGTWPSMRSTLAKIGVSETELFRECEASFKQGAKFAKWVTGEADDYYYHPLVLPLGMNETDLVLPWQKMRSEIPFGDAVCYQGAICENGLAPKLITTPEYGAVANYAYHLNSNKLGEFLRRHCINKLGVKHILDHVSEVVSDDDDYIKSLGTKKNGLVEGDLFIDCSGFASVLIGNHYDIPFEEYKHILFNDRAIAVQVPYADERSEIASHTISTAQKNGWIWDIGLPSRRGVGYVFSSSHTDDDAALQELEAYIAPSVGRDNVGALSYRTIPINPGRRSKFWHKNCVAIGMAAGFLEPLEASALVLVESSAEMISADLPVNRKSMAISSKRFNQRLEYHWNTIIDFLKLHYVLTKRADSDYWRDNLRPETIPERLQESLELWKYQVPNRFDFPLGQEMFPAASWQYVLYGMGFYTTDSNISKRFTDDEKFRRSLQEVKAFASKCVQNLPKNRDLIDKICEYGLQKV